jgi:2-octaprenyl-6-methoxyphenol hydroxylase
MSKTLGLSTEQGTTEIAYQLLIAADGVCSKTRELLGVDVDETDYQQSALVTRVELSQENHGVAYQRVTSLGTLALLPIDKKRCGVIISGAKEKIENWLALNDEQFLLQLQSCFGFKLGRLLAVTKRLNYPLKMVIAKQQVVNSAIVMGNAAHLIHPVAAQGFNLSMQDIAVLTELTQEAVKRGESIASPQLLADYLAWRQGAQDKTIHATDSLVSLFSSDSRLLKQARHLGLMGLEYAPILKPMFARFAMGLSGKQAKLIQN